MRNPRVYVSFLREFSRADNKAMVADFVRNFSTWVGPVTQNFFRENYFQIWMLSLVLTVFTFLYFFLSNSSTFLLPVSFSLFHCPELISSRDMMERVLMALGQKAQVREFQEKSDLKSICSINPYDEELNLEPGIKRKMLLLSTYDDSTATNLENILG